MLVLTRKPGEGIIIGDNITIKIIESRGGTVRVGIDAPANTKIYRKELYDIMAKENRNAAAWDLKDLDALRTDISIGKKLHNEND